MIVRQRVPSWAWRLAVWATASFAIATAHLPLETWGGLAHYTDERAYLAVMQGGFVISSPFRYRVVVPALAGMVPSALVGHLASVGSDPNDWSGAARFAVVNFTLLVSLGIVLFAYLRRVGLGERAAFVTTLLFYVMRPVVQNGGLPSVDPGAWLCLVLTLWLALEGKVLWMLPLFAVGMFVKETLLLAIPLIALTSQPLRTRAWQIAATVPGIAAYVAVRWFIAPPRNERYYSFWTNLAHPQSLGSNVAALVTQPERLLEVFSAFGFAWALVAVGFMAWRRGGRSTEAIAMPRAWRWFPLLLVALIVLLSLDVGRVLFLAFPVLLPFAGLAVVQLIGDEIGIGEGNIDGQVRDASLP